MQKTNIPWTEYTWNPLTGCELPLASSGCSHCYARELHNKRHKAYLAGKKLPIQYDKPFEEIQLFTDRLNEPLHKKKPCKIATCLMGDLFHPQVPFEFIDKVFATIRRCPQHTFQILTKQSMIAKEYITGLANRLNGTQLVCMLNFENWLAARLQYFSSSGWS